MVFSMPDTVMLRHCPVITTVLLIPLTSTTLSLQVIVLLSPMPDTWIAPPLGGTDALGVMLGAGGRFLTLLLGGTPNGPPPPPDTVGLPLNVWITDLTPETALAK